MSQGYDIEPRRHSYEDTPVDAVSRPPPPASAFAQSNYFVPQTKLDEETVQQILRNYNLPATHSPNPLYIPNIPEIEARLAYVHQYNWTHAEKMFVSSIPPHNCEFYQGSGTLDPEFRRQVLHNAPRDYAEWVLLDPGQSAVSALSMNRSYAPPPPSTFATSTASGRLLTGLESTSALNPPNPYAHLPLELLTPTAKAALQKSKTRASPATNLLAPSRPQKKEKSKAKAKGKAKATQVPTQPATTNHSEQDYQEAFLVKSLMCRRTLLFTHDKSIKNAQDLVDLFANFHYNKPSGETRRTVAAFAKFCHGSTVFANHSAEELNVFVRWFIKGWVDKEWRSGNGFLIDLASALQQIDEGLEIMRDEKKVEEEEF